MVAAVAAVGRLPPHGCRLHAWCEAGAQTEARTRPAGTAEACVEVPHSTALCIVSGAREGCVELEHFL